MDRYSAAAAIMYAVLGMALLTATMSTWAGLARLAALKRAGLELEDFAHVADAGHRLPSPARRVNDNYNHLLEAPTVFYATSFSIVILGQASWLYAYCAITYLALRAAHSMVQATFNRVSVRAPLYILSWLVLLPMIVGPLLAIV